MVNTRNSHCCNKLTQLVATDTIAPCIHPCSACCSFTATMNLPVSRRRCGRHCFVSYFRRHEAHLQSLYTIYSCPAMLCDWISMTGATSFYRRRNTYQRVYGRTAYPASSTSLACRHAIVEWWKRRSSTEAAIGSGRQLQRNHAIVRLNWARRRVAISWNKAIMLRARLVDPRARRSDCGEANIEYRVWHDGMCHIKQTTKYRPWCVGIQFNCESCEVL